ncbi:MAG: NFACT family protein [Candidatus Micrarchaeia archaeon]
MRDIAASELFVAVQELKRLIEGKRLNNFYDLSGNAFRLDFEENAVYVRLGKTINATRFKEEAGQASQFAIAIRKYVKGARLEAIKQRGMDRLVFLKFSRGIEKYWLIFEMFAKGNAVLVDSERKILQVFAKREFKDRSLTVSSKYVLPKGSSFNLAKADAETLEEKIKESCAESNDKLIRTLSFINIGPLYLDELIRQAGLDPNMPAKEALPSMHSLLSKLIEFKQVLESPKPVAYLSNNQVVDYSIMPLSKYSDLKPMPFNSMNELLDFVYAQERVEIKNEEKKEKIEEIEKSIEKQKQLHKEYASKAVTYREIANKIFQNMQQLNEVIALASSNKAEKAQASGGFRIVKIDKQNKRIVVEID